MKYHLETIPVWDAYRAGAECPLCLLHESSEASYAEGFLGGSVMEPETRVMTNEKGFCQKHLHQLFDLKQRHPLALMAHTHLKHVLTQLDREGEKAQRGLAGKRGLGRREADPAEALAGCLAHQNSSCILCERLETAMHRYALTIGHLWRTDQEFAAAFAQSRGFCQPHFAYMLQICGELPRGERAPFQNALIELQRANMKRMEEELAWYIEKMDYNKRDLPWGTSRDALTRALTKLRGSTYSD